MWGKQVLYALLRQELESSMAKTTMDSFSHEDLLPLYRPQLTHAGTRELDSNTGKVSTGTLKLLKLSQQNKTVIDICMSSAWTLEQCAIYLLEAMDKELALRPNSGIVMGTINYLANRIRLGEYLVKIGRLSVEQLDQALRTQRYIEESLGEKTGIANVLINLGYINKLDSEAILFFKEESKKPFKPLPMGAQAAGGAAAGPMIDAATFEKLQRELLVAREQIRQLQITNQQQRR